LEGDPVLAQDLPQPFPADLHRPDSVAGQVVGELAKTPVCERTPQHRRAGHGRRDDELAFVVTDEAGTASRPPRVQRGQALLVECGDHIADGVLVRGDQPSIAFTGVPDADAMMIKALRTRTDSCLPRRTICCSL
jgi:hypothetical protein